MRTKIIAALLAVLTALGGLNLFKSIKERLFPPATAQTAVVESSTQVTEESDSRVRIRVKAKTGEAVRERAKIRVSEGSNTMIDRRFAVREGQSLFVDIEHADVEVRTGNDVREAHVLVTLDSNDMARAREIYEDMEFSVEMVGDEIRVVSESPRGNWNSNWNGGMDIDVDITIPDRFNATMKTTHGDVELGDLTGMVNLNTTHGDVSVGSIEGPQIALKTTHGDIEGEHLAGESVTINTSHADIEFDTVAASRMSATTSHSDIVIARLSAESEIRTSHGDIEIALTDMFETELNTSHGDVVVYIPSGGNAELDLKGAQVKVSGDISLVGDIEKDRVEGRLGRGGARLYARTTHGSVNVRQR